jgi:hypothetical protein
MPDIDDERRLSRKEAAEFLTNLGYKTASATLAKLASVGGGPLFESFGRKPLYRSTDLLEWAQARSSGPRRSTSDRGDKTRHQQSPD